MYLHGRIWAPLYLQYDIFPLTHVPLEIAMGTCTFPLNHEPTKQIK